MTFPKGLIVSSQALEGNPFRNSELLAIMAEAAVLGGAAAIRANGVEDITAMRKRVSVPIIGIDKKKDTSGRTVITPDFEGVKRIAEAGANIIAMEVVDYPSDIREDRKELIRRIHEELGLLVMADISTLKEACDAAMMGADAISTTLAGYIPGALHTEESLYEPDFDLLRKIKEKNLPCTLVAEGRIWDKEAMAQAFRCGADAVVIGKAITNPMAITRYFNSVVPRCDTEVPFVTTESVNPETAGISAGTTEEILHMINREDSKVPSIVASNIPRIADLVDKAVECVNNGGHIVYCGAGTSGRLAVADAAECPPTYGLNPDTIRAVIAGGSKAIVIASEGCEDSVEKGAAAFCENGCTGKDFVIGISAAGRAPFVLSFMNEAKKNGCTVGALVNNLNTEMAEAADIAVELLTGAEAIKGSTRMKAGTSQKLTLNMFSTAVCIKLGCTYRNYMVNMIPSNSKLRKRAATMICELTGMKDEDAVQLLEKHSYDIRAALKEVL